MTALVDHSRSGAAPEPFRARVVAAAAVAPGWSTWWARTPAPIRAAMSLRRCRMSGVPTPHSGSTTRSRRRTRRMPRTPRTADPALLDRRAAAWSVMRVESCQATARGTQTPGSPSAAQALPRCAARRADRHRRHADARAERRHRRAGLARGERAAEIQSRANINALLEQAPEPAVAAQLQLDVARADTLEKLGETNLSASPRAACARTRARLGAALARVDGAIGHEPWRRGESAAGLEPLREGATGGAREG